MKNLKIYAIYQYCKDKKIFYTFFQREEEINAIKYIEYEEEDASGTAIKISEPKNIFFYIKDKNSEIAEISDSLKEKINIFLDSVYQTENHRYLNNCFYEILCSLKKYGISELN